MKKSYLLTILMVLLLSANVTAGSPNILNYQGRLTGKTGNPVSDGVYSIKFKIYESKSGDDSLWSSGFRNLTVTDGLFSIKLGANLPYFPEDLFTGDTLRYLGITVEGDEEISPRVRLTSSPYTFHAGIADSLTSAPYVNRTGDTVSGHIYFDGDGLGTDAELLLYNDLSIMNFYQSGAKRITLESEFGTVVLRGQDGDQSLIMSGGEDPTDGGTLRLNDSEGFAKIKLDGGRSGNTSVVLPDDAIDSDEILNEAGVGLLSWGGLYSLEYGVNTMQELVTFSFTIPEDGHIVLELNCTATISGTTGKGIGHLRFNRADGSGASLSKVFGLSGYESGYENHFHISMMFKFTSDAGINSFHIEGMQDEGNSSGATITISNIVVIPHYYPTLYSSMIESVKGSEASTFDKADSVSTISLPGDADSGMDEANNQVDLRELELKAQEARIKALEAELELRKARDKLNADE